MLTPEHAHSPPPTQQPTTSPTPSPTPRPTPPPTPSPTPQPTDSPTASPTPEPTPSPTTSPTVSPTASPTDSPTPSPTPSPTTSPTDSPTVSPTASPTDSPTTSPTASPTPAPTQECRLTVNTTETSIMCLNATHVDITFTFDLENIVAGTTLYLEVTDATLNMDTTESFALPVGTNDDVQFTMNAVEFMEHYFYTASTAIGGEPAFCWINIPAKMHLANTCPVTTGAPTPPP